MNGIIPETTKWLVTALDTRNIISAQEYRNELPSTMKMEAVCGDETLVTNKVQPAKPQQYIQRR
jgi:hypothetical protein